MADSVQDVKTKAAEKWYLKPWAIVVAILMFGPFGLIPLWMHPKIKVYVKLIISVVVFASTIWFIQTSVTVYEELLAYYKELSAVMK